MKKYPWIYSCVFAASTLAQTGCVSKIVDDDDDVGDTGETEEEEEEDTSETTDSEGESSEGESSEGESSEGESSEGESSEGESSETDTVLSHDADIQPLWDANCVSNCHQPGGSASFLDLGDGYSAMVGVSSTQASLMLVDAGSSADSYVVAKLRGTQAEAGGAGSQMPVGTDALPEDDISLIELWIDQGAAP
ncbi:hypothetical protein G6O69_01385 [Pseudenhygromyxa sp. WMMC2535]|uniref:hypothetical protein n=1 Tax=Pseudenhygromyxa sp. WMMC2535 TaxID=2712867 RepID=UPI001556E6EF|nr:hypothetical protein [Pseudenhygromyxa sp. WMMC2535]NVB36465.1 hypothetical protein [Pseudenhygromyxa sp. WMMC2535]